MRVEVRGRVLGYDDSGGAGTPLVLVHGFPLNRTIWSAQVRGLSGHARVLAPDLRGFGESWTTGDAVATTMDDYATDIAELLDALGIESAVLGGVSMGGYVAMAFQRLFAARLRGLLLVDTRGGPDDPEARRTRDETAALVRAQGGSAVAAKMLPQLLTPATARADVALARALSDMMSTQPVDGIVGALAAIRDRPDSRASFSGITVPTLVVCGAEDELIPPAESEALRDAIPGARLVLIAGAAHLPNYERPEAFNGVVREFLATL